TAWTGDSASSVPVAWFWSVGRGASPAALTNLTSAAHDSAPGDVAFGALGEAVYLGFPEEFRELNVNLAKAASGGWQCVFEYVAANGPPPGVSPPFDAAADANGDGYLTDAEYATRANGKNARFDYESRLFYPYYGQMRFVTNPSSVNVQQWAADYHVRFLAA